MDEAFNERARERESEVKDGLSCSSADPISGMVPTEVSCARHPALHQLAVVIITHSPHPSLSASAHGPFSPVCPLQPC